MRMWMVDPRIMCHNHILGEHKELHMIVGSIQRGIGLNGYIEHNCLQPLDIPQRHDDLVTEFYKRGWPSGLNHNKHIYLSDMNNIHTYPKHISHAKVDRKASLQELLRRCPKCQERYNQLKTKGEI